MYNTNNGMYAGYEVEANKESFTETKSSSMNAGSAAGMNTASCGMGIASPLGASYGMSMPGIVTAPVYECPQERVIHREICHEVPHICPINTRIVNHHIYRHTYSPCYTCCEENEICNVTDGCCSNF